MQGLRAWRLPSSASYRLWAPAASARACPSAGHVHVRPWALLTGCVSCGFKTRGGDTDVLPVCPCSCSRPSFLPSCRPPGWPLATPDSNRLWGNSLHRLLHKLSHSRPGLAPMISSQFYSFDGSLRDQGAPTVGSAFSPWERSRAVACPTVLETEHLICCSRGIRNSQKDPWGSKPVPAFFTVRLASEPPVSQCVDSFLSLFLPLWLTGALLPELKNCERFRVIVRS